MTIISNLGFPRIGRRRELKTALERFWAGTTDEVDLQAEATRLRAIHWRLQVGLGVGHVPSGDASLYDHVLDTACMLGAIPAGYGWQGGPVSLPTYFALARGARDSAEARGAGIAPGLPALEMTKWFDTNYHYLVPRLSRDQRFVLTENRAQRRLRQHVGRRQILFDLDDGFLGIDHVEIEHGVDLDGHVVARDEVLARHLVDDGA